MRRGVVGVVDVGEFVDMVVEATVLVVVGVAFSKVLEIGYRIHVATATSMQK